MNYPAKHRLSVLTMVVLNVLFPSIFSMISSKYSMYLGVRFWMGITIVILFFMLSYIAYTFIQKEKKRQRSFEMLINSAPQEANQMDDMLSSLVHAHEFLRQELFHRFFKGAYGYDSLESADGTVKCDLSYSDSWQRKLCGEAKQKLKTVLLRRAIATLQLYQSSRKEHAAKNLLYQKGLLTAKHFDTVQNQHQQLIEDIDWIIFEANCIEENWGSASEGIFHMAAAILQHEKLKAPEQKRKSSLLFKESNEKSH